MSKSERKQKKYKGILKQIRLPMILSMLVCMVIIMLLGSSLIINLGTTEMIEKVDSQARMGGLRISEYKARAALKDYWLEHADDLDPVYDEAALDEMERQFKEKHPEFIILREVTDDDFRNLDEDCQRLYARLVHGRISHIFDEIKGTFGPQWLFYFVMDGKDMHVLVTGASNGEKRISQGGDLFDLGLVVPVDLSDYPELNKLVTYYDENPDIIGPVCCYDIDSKLKSIGVWVPVVTDDNKLVAVVGASMTNRDLYSSGLFLSTVLAVIVALSVLAMEIQTIRIIRRKVVGPITAEEATVRSYMDTKDAAKTVSALSKITSANEIESLAESFSQMVEEVDRYVGEIRNITAEKERIGAELNVARQIQANMLPVSLTGYNGVRDFEITAYMGPAKEVAGDFYDYFVIDDDHIGLTIADVSGKGVPAALFMAVCKTLIKSMAKEEESPAEIISKVNRRLCENNPDMMFVTVWFGIYNVSTHEIHCVNAGHEYPAIYRASSGQYELVIEEHDLMLGFDSEASYTERTITLNPGDKIYVYTDGVPEATRVDDTLYGTDRMIDALNHHISENGHEIFESLCADIEKFTEGAEQYDDITMLLFEYRCDS